MPRSAAQSHALDHLDFLRSELSDWTATIFDFGETAWREYRSADWYVRTLRAHGFSVEEGSAGMPTAFAAVWSNGPGPSIGLYAEYDAVPGNCQAATTRRMPRDGLSVHAGGHTDPHSGLGIAGLGVLLIAADRVPGLEMSSVGWASFRAICLSSVTTSVSIFPLPRA